MAGTKKDEARPPRYDDLVGENQPAAAVRSGAAPASVSRAQAGSGVEAFDRNTREDSPQDPDRGKKRPPRSSDPVSFALGLGSFSPGASFPWCRDYAGIPVRFSRLYTDPDVLVDLFANDSPAVRAEVEKKRAAIALHNVLAREDVAKVREAAENEALRAQERDETARTNVTPFDTFIASGAGPRSLESHVAEQMATGMAYLRREGRVPYAYVPLLGPIRPGDIDPASFANAEILDLPPSREVEETATAGFGTRVTRR